MSALTALSLEEVEALRPTPSAHADEFFSAQPSRSSDLPDPEPLVLNLSRSIIEILAGARELDQIARWVSDDVFRNLLKRVILAERARRVRGEVPIRPSFRIGSVHLSEPRDGAVEAVVVVHSRVRSRAVALRLEGLDRRWRATALSVL